MRHRKSTIYELAEAVQGTSKGFYTTVYKSELPSPEPSVLAYMSMVQGNNYLNFAERILENIIGSAYEYFYHDCGSYYTFYRLTHHYPSESNLRTYVSPDHRDYYSGKPGMYLRKDQTTHFNQDDIPIQNRIYFGLDAIRKDFRYLTPWRCFNDC